MRRDTTTIAQSTRDSHHTCTHVMAPVTLPIVVSMMLGCGPRGEEVETSRHALRDVATPGICDTALSSYTSGSGSSTLSTGNVSVQVHVPMQERATAEPTKLPDSVGREQPAPIETIKQTCPSVPSLVTPTNK